MSGRKCRPLSKIDLADHDYLTGIYAATKAALSTWSETLRLEVEPLGVSVITLQTGAVESAFSANTSYPPLPADSWYRPIESTIAKWAAGAMYPKAQSQRSFCKSVMHHIENGRMRGLVFEGALSWVTKYMASLIPRWLLVSNKLLWYVLC